MVDLQKISVASKEIASKEIASKQNCLDDNWSKSFSYFSYVIIATVLTLVSSESLAVDLGKFGKGVTEPLVKFAADYWVYGAGIGGITTALLSEGDGRTRVFRGGTVFVGSSAICMGILAAMS
jgi:hypothetical protein